MATCMSGMMAGAVTSRFILSILIVQIVSCQIVFQSTTPLPLHRYLTTVRTDNWMTGEASHDLWQAFLFARKDEWSDVHIPFKRFLLTWKGKLVETRSEINARSIISISISLAGSDSKTPANPQFHLGIDYIKAQRSDGLTPLE